MVIIYCRKTGIIRSAFTGNTSQIGWYHLYDNSLIGEIGEVISDDFGFDVSDIKNYRVKIINGEEHIYKKVHINIEQHKNMLKITLDNLQDFDEIDKIPLLINGEKLEVEPGEYEIELNSNKPVEIHVDSKQFTYEPLVWEVD